VKKRKAGPRDAGKMVDYEIPDYGVPESTSKNVVKIPSTDQKSGDKQNDTDNKKKN